MSNRHINCSTLTIDLHRLVLIRAKNAENSRRRLAGQCSIEVAEVALCQKSDPWINKINYSVEEITNKIRHIMGLSRRNAVMRTSVD